MENFSQAAKSLRERFESEGIADRVDWRALEKSAKLADEGDERLQRKLSKTFNDKTDIEALVAAVKREKQIDRVMKNFKFTVILIDWLRSVPFFNELSRWIAKRPDESIPTAGVRYDTVTDNFEMCYNPRFLAGFLVDHPECLSDGSIVGEKMIHTIIEHEFKHLLLGHLRERRREPHVAWNIATDAAINSLIDEHSGVMPPGLILPGTPFIAPSGRKMTEEESVALTSLNALIVSWPKLQSSERYFNELMKWAATNNYKFSKNGLKVPAVGGGMRDSDSEGGSGDDVEISISDTFEDSDVHDMWDDLTPEQREFVKEKLNEMVRGAVRKAEQTNNGWGTISAALREQIKSSVDDRVDWKSVLRTFIGTFNKGTPRPSIKKINRRYPYVHPGRAKSYLPHLAIFVDQSGSVSDEQLSKFCDVLVSLARQTKFTFIPFDHTVDEENIFVWKKGARPTLHRTRGGGTSFDAVAEYVNDKKNVGKWDGYIILTDGECSKPRATKKKRAWCIAPGHKLMFDTDELVISMDDDSSQARKGAWR